jgi:hypothetical protein
LYGIAIGESKIVTNGEAGIVVPQAKCGRFLGCGLRSE